jgi:hypothetical protein
VKTELQKNPNTVDSPIPKLDKTFYAWAFVCGIAAALEILSLVFHWGAPAGFR